MTDQEKRGLFKNEVEIQEIGRPMPFRDFEWERPISSMMRCIEKLTDADINYAIHTDCKNKCQVIYIDYRNKSSANDALKEE